MTLNTDKYNQSINLLCPTCGGTQFSHDESDDQSTGMVTCASCGLEIVKADLVRANSENVSEHVEDMKKKILKDVEKELRESLKKAFGGNKNIRFK